MTHEPIFLSVEIKKSKLNKIERQEKENPVIDELFSLPRPPLSSIVLLL